MGITALARAAGTRDSEGLWAFFGSQVEVTQQAKLLDPLAPGVYKPCLSPSESPTGHDMRRPLSSKHSLNLLRWLPG